MPNDSSRLTSTLQILLIDTNPAARRTLVLQDALRELARAGGTYGHTNFNVVNVPLAEHSLDLTALRENRSVCFVAVNEKELSSLEKGQLPRKPCDSVTRGYELLDQLGPGVEIYFLVREITGVEVISLLLSGARGVVDIDVLGSVDVLRTILDGIYESDKLKNRIVIGSPYRKLDLLIQTARVKWRIALEHWNLLLAIAEIPVNRLSCRGKPTQENIARAIGRYSNITGYVVIEGKTSRKVPSVLGHLRGELDEQSYENGSLHYDDQDYYDKDEPDQPDDQNGGLSESAGKSTGRGLTRQQKLELPLLPLYAHRLGFPVRLLRIRGLPESELAGRLYKGLRGIDVLSTRNKSGIGIANVTLARELWK